MASNGNGLHSLRLLDYSDRELLLLIDELPSENGWVTTGAVAEAVGVTGEFPKRAVGSRLGAMRRIGAIEKDPEGQISRWRVTDVGAAMAHGRLKAGLQRALDSAGTAEALVLVREITKKQRNLSDTAAHLMRREWQYGTHR